MENTTYRCHDALHHAGWCTGERAIATWAGVRYFVDGTNGETVTRAKAATSADAWLQAVAQTRALGMLDGECRFFA
jgi:hypothetical protein